MEMVLGICDLSFLPIRRDCLRASGKNSASANINISDQLSGPLTAGSHLETSNKATNSPTSFNHVYLTRFVLTLMPI
jgi:hypothetical protein